MRNVDADLLILRLKDFESFSLNTSYKMLIKRVVIPLVEDCVKLYNERSTYDRSK